MLRFISQDRMVCNFNLTKGKRLPLTNFIWSKVIFKIKLPIILVFFVKTELKIVILNSKLMYFFKLTLSSWRPFTHRVNICTPGSILEVRRAQSTFRFLSVAFPWSSSSHGVCYLYIENKTEYNIFQEYALCYFFAWVCPWYCSGWGSVEIISIMSKVNRFFFILVLYHSLSFVPSSAFILFLFLLVVWFWVCLHFGDRPFHL